MKLIFNFRFRAIHFLHYASINLLHLARKNVDFVSMLRNFLALAVGDDEILRGF
jgi:hypothetical protein